jgi:hypothetical protein
MSCILTIGGRNFNVDEFIEKTKLRPYKITYKGQPRIKTKPDGEKLKHSSLSIATSKAGFDDLAKQIADSIRFLKRHQEKLTLLSSTKGIEYAVLNFGINLRIDKANILIQSDKFPHQLLKLAGNIGLDIELTIYPVDLTSILAKKHSKKKQPDTKR